MAAESHTVSAIRSVARNTLALTVGQIISKGLGIVYFAALGRYVQATGLGQIATAQSLCAVAFVFVNLGLDMLTVRDVARNRGQAGPYFANTAILKVILGSIGVLILLLLGWVGPYSPVTRMIIFIYSLGYLTSAVIGITRSLFQAYEKMEYDGLLQVGRDVLNIGASLLAIALQASLEVIVWISVWSSVLQLLGAVLILRTLGISLRGKVEFRFCRQLLVAAIPFAALAIAATLYNQVNAVLLPILQGEQATGLYSAANMFYTTLVLIPGMFAQAIFPVFCRFHESSRAKLGMAYQRAFKLLTVIGLPMAAAIVLFAEPMMQLMFGPGFDDAVWALRILGLMFAFSGSHVSGAVMNAAGKQNLFATTYGGFVVLQLVLTIVLVPPLGPAGASLSLFLCSAVGFVFYAAVCHRFLELSPDLKMGAKALLATLIMAGICQSAMGAGVHFVLVALLAPVIYGVMSLLLRIVSAEEWSLLRQAFSLKRDRLASDELAM